MASLADVGDNVTISVKDKDERIVISISGTYEMVLELQREVGSPRSGTWETLRTYDGTNTTFSEDYYTESFNERLRLIVVTDTSGTAVATLTDTTKLLNTVTDIVGNDLAKWYQGAFVPVRTPVTLTADTTITEADHAYRPIVLSAATGLTATLPAATGSGNVYKFYVATDISSNDYVIQVASAADVLQGFAIIADSADDTLSMFETAADSDTMTMGATDPSTGGQRGDIITIVDVASGLFSVEAMLLGDGVQATPFSAGV